MKFPSIEELFDMDLDQLLELKKNILNGNIDDKNININEDEDDYDYYGNEQMTKETMLEFVNNEIKERNMMNDVLNFFLKSNIEKEDKFSFDKKEENKEKEVGKLNNFENKYFEKNTILNQEQEQKNKLFNFDLKQKPIIPKQNEKIGDLLNRTKIKAEDFQYIVSSSSLMKPINFFRKAQKRKKEKLEPIEEKKPNYINYLPMVKKKRKRKKKKNEDNEIIEVKNNPLELMRKYEVPDIKKFPKRKNILTPITKNINSKQNFEKNNNHVIKEEINQVIENKKEEKKIIDDKNKIMEITNFNGFNIINDNNNDKVIEEFQIQKTSLEFIKGKRPISSYDKNNFEIINGKNYSVKKENFNFLMIDNNNQLNVISEIKNIKQSNNNNNEINEKILNDNEEDITKKICKEIKKNYTNENIKKENKEILNYENIKIENKEININSKDDNISITSKTSSKTNNITQDIKEKKNESLKEKEDNDIYEYENEENENEEDEEENSEKPIENDLNQDSIYKVNDYQNFSESQLSQFNKNVSNIKKKIKSKESIKIDASVREKNKNKQSIKRNKNENINNSNNIKVQNENINSIRETIYNSIHNDKKNKKIKNDNNDNNINNKNNSNNQELKKEENSKRLKSANPSSTRIKSSEKKPNTKNQTTPNSTNQNYQNKNITHRPQSNIFQSKTNLITSQQLNTENIIDYSEIYHNFYELFSGYFLSSTYSQAKEFNFDQTMQILYDSFKHLHYYESNTSLIEQKDEMYADIVRAEAGVIQNRLKNVSSKLLNEPDIDSNIPKYILLRQCLDLEKKNYARSPSQYNINSNKNKLFFRVVLSRPEIYDIVCYTLYHYSEWSELPHGLSLGQCWNLLWTYGAPGVDFNKIFSFQKVNHLINSRTVHRKDLLQKQINRVRKLNKKLNEIFDIMPQTFLLSKEYMGFIEEFSRIKKTNEYNIWIVKPVGRSRGKGIFLIDDMSDVPLSESYLVQRYLTNPLLLDEGYKFDMRIYTLITSTNPLEMFLYKDGFARVSNELFSLDIKNIRTHLTNAAIQNRRANQKNYEKLYGGSKISLDLLKYKLEKQYNIDFDELIWPQVKELILKALIACQHDIPYCPSTFEMFGFDVIIDDNYKCWLLEINSSPSLERSNVLDDQIKLPLVDDIFKIVDPININRDALIKMMERVMKINNKGKNKNVYLYSQKIQLNMDLTEIFYGKVPRKYGEVPKDMGKFEMICPTKESDKLIRMTGGQKWYNRKRDKEEKKII